MRLGGMDIILHYTTLYYTATHHNEKISFFKFIWRGGERERVHEHLCEWGRGKERLLGRLHAISVEPHTGLHLANHEIMT